MEKQAPDKEYVRQLQNEIAALKKELASIRGELHNITAALYNIAKCENDELQGR